MTDNAFPNAATSSAIAEWSKRADEFPFCVKSLSHGVDGPRFEHIAFFDVHEMLVVWVQRPTKPLSFRP